MKQSSQRGIIWLLVFLSLGSLASLQALFDRANTPFITQQRKAVLTLSEPLIPGTNALKLLSLGDGPVVADLLWLQTIQYFGAGSPYQNYPALGKMLTAITTLDPHFNYPYQFALIVLPFMNQTDTAIKLGEQGVKLFPDDGLMAYYLASTYFLNVKDYNKAAEYYLLAAKRPGHPSAAEHLAAVAKSQIHQTTNDRLIARDYWLDVARQSTTNDEHDRATNWASQMQIVFDLETQAVNFKNHFGRFPITLQELVSTHFVPSIPDSPVERVLRIDPQNGIIDFSKIAQAK